MFGIGISFASFRRFWAVAARSWGTFGLRRRSSLRMRSRWAASRFSCEGRFAPNHVRPRGRTWHLPSRSIRRAHELEGASCAVVSARAVEHRRIIIHECASRGQFLAARAEVSLCQKVSSRRADLSNTVTRDSMPGSRSCQLCPSQGTPISLLKTTKTVITSPMLH